MFYKDGVIVDQAPDILWLRDTNGDGKCDMQSERVVLFTGFGTGDTDRLHLAADIDHAGTPFAVEMSQLIFFRSHVHSIGRN